MKLRITVEGKTYEVDVEVLDEGSAGPMQPAVPTSDGSAASQSPQPVASKPASVSTTPSTTSERVVKAPIAGTIFQLKVEVGDTIALNQVLLVMEAMKMETSVASPLAGKVKAIIVSPGDAVKAGQVLVEME